MSLRASVVCLCRGFGLFRWALSYYFNSVIKKPRLPSFLIRLPWPLWNKFGLKSPHNILYILNSGRKYRCDVCVDQQPLPVFTSVTSEWTKPSRVVCSDACHVMFCHVPLVPDEVCFPGWFIRSSAEVKQIGHNRKNCCEYWCSLQSS